MEVTLEERGINPNGSPRQKKPPAQRTTGSVLQDWVMDLPLKGQGTVITALRGCDVTPREPDDAIETQLTRFIRWCVMIPAPGAKIDVPGAFFATQINTAWSASDLDPFPLHWYLHMMEAFGVVGYMHPNVDIADRALQIYTEMVMHLNLGLEPKDKMMARLSS